MNILIVDDEPDMQALFEQRFRKAIGNDPFSSRVTIGINSGEVISGNIGSANLRRLDYTVIGDVVNTAQRLQSAAQPGQIMISEAGYHKIKESFHCNRIGERAVKNKTGVLTVYEVLD